MNKTQFKQLIKEAVREVLKEELGTLQNSSPINENLSFTTDDVHSVAAYRNQLKRQMDERFGIKPNLETQPDGIKVPKGNNFDAFLLDSAANMNPHEFRSLSNLD